MVLELFFRPLLLSWRTLHFLLEPAILEPPIVDCQPLRQQFLFFRTGPHCLIDHIDPRFRCKSLGLLLGNLRRRCCRSQKTFVGRNHRPQPRLVPCFGERDRRHFSFEKVSQAVRHMRWGKIPFVRSLPESRRVFFPYRAGHLFPHFTLFK